MAEKIQKLGICDTCLGRIKKRDWYTKKGFPRLHCSLECRQADNSRRGNPARVEKIRQHIADGTWVNPADGLSSERRSELNAKSARAGRLREVKEGRWRNPALSPAAREKLSRARKHSGALHAAIEKLRHSSMESLSTEERAAYLDYRKRLREARKRKQNKNKTTGAMK